jgi:2-haloacid dehalogenase
MLDFSRFRLITFDCYGTLIDWETGILGALRPILSSRNIRVDDAELLRLYGDFEFEAESGEFRSYREVLQQVVRRFGKQFDFAPDPAEQSSLPNSIGHWQPFPDTVAALHHLKSKLKVGIISNIDDDLFATTRSKLQVAFDAVTTAGEASAYKPSRRIFEAAEKKLGVARSEWLHAGQSVFHDVVPAKDLGIAAVWVNRPSRRPNAGAAKQSLAKPTLEVKSLQELASLVAPGI